MTWNYRVIKRKIVESGEEGEYVGIHEVYYDDEGKPNACTVDVVAIGWCESLDEIKLTLERMREACDKPILNYEDF